MAPGTKTDSSEEVGMEEKRKPAPKPARVVVNVHEELSKVFIFLDEVKERNLQKEFKTYKHAVEAMKTMKLMLGARVEGPCPGTTPL
jgi:hypothetical protein